MTLKSFGLPDELHRYVLDHSSPVDPVLADLADETAREHPDVAGMQIAPEQGLLMTLLVRLSGAEQAVEVGTFTGYSSICIARGLRPGGRLQCFDRSDEWTATARRYWERDGVADRIDLKVGDAREELRQLPAEPFVDFAFIDADKSGYAEYFELLLPRLAPEGLIVVDNVLASGAVLDPSSNSAEAIAAFNDQVAADERVDVVLLPVADGLSLITHARSG